MCVCELIKCFRSLTSNWTILSNKNQKIETMIFHGCSMVFFFHNSSCAGPVSDGVVWVLDSRFQLVRRLHKFGMPLGRGVVYSYVFMFIICLIWWPRVLAGCQRHSQNFVKDRSVSGALVDRLGTAMVEFNYSTPHPAHVCSKLLNMFQSSCKIVSCGAAYRVSLYCLVSFDLLCIAALLGVYQGGLAWYYQHS